MFVNLRCIKKIQIARLLTTGLVLSIVMLCWEDLDHHVVSHVRSYSYRFLVNNHNFLNSSYNLDTNGHRRSFGNSLDPSPLHPYLINQLKKCSNSNDILLLVFVKSSPQNDDRRHEIRKTWGNEDYIQEKFNANVKIVFVLGVHPDLRQRRSQKNVESEAWAYNDIIQQNFMDTFHNLTTKLIMQFHWATKYCPKAKFVMSCDDDIFVHMPNMVGYLRSLEQKHVSNFWVGHVHRGAPPIRRIESKYHVPMKLYPWVSYPDYTSGAGYVVSGDVAAKIYQVMQILNPSMYIDDVFMGMCAQVIGVTPQDYVYFSGEAVTRYHPCIYARMITSHGHADDVRVLWKEATDPQVERMSKGFLSNLYCTAVKVALLCLPHQRGTYGCLGAFT
ncbi:lactosylceramide 1,3-N-acetyl-beta-D-glucosaminyltransferase A [Eucyclogobius newberryi]|uniref:lactosylceramide 1,3-N-acetyl-beta-D-glucosaminyltransferase A n=1 Tax=Eucyclogobius newberryi TaxID=166745 RepID=UPI003B5A5AE2